MPSASKPRRGLARFYGACGGKEADHGSACCPDRKPRLEFLLRSILSPRSSKWRAVRSGSFSRAALYLKSAIRPSPTLFSTCPTRPITAFDISARYALIRCASLPHPASSDARRADEIAEHDRERRRKAHNEEPVSTPKRAFPVRSHTEGMRQERYLVIIIPFRQQRRRSVLVSGRGGESSRLGRSLAHSFFPTSGKTHCARNRIWLVCEIAASTRS